MRARARPTPQPHERAFQACSPEGRYDDPLTVAEGRDTIDATIAAGQSQFPA